MKVKLYAPVDYWKQTPEEKKKNCNGCGPKGFGLLIPDTIYGLKITEPCHIHDWIYGQLFPHSNETKEFADRVLYNNIVRIINAKTRWGWLKKLRYRRAWIYYILVAKFGNCAYWSGKNKSEEGGEVEV